MFPSNGFFVGSRGRHAKTDLDSYHLRIILTLPSARGFSFGDTHTYPLLAVFLSRGGKVSEGESILTNPKKTQFPTLLSAFLERGGSRRRVRTDF